MARRIKQYDSLPYMWQKQILTGLKRNKINLLDVDVQQAKKKAVLINSDDEEWLVIIDMQMSEVEDEDDDYDSYENDYDTNEEDLNTDLVDED